MKKANAHSMFLALGALILILSILSCSLPGAGLSQPNSTGKYSSTAKAPAVQGSATGSDQTLETRPVDIPAEPAVPAWTPQLQQVLTRDLVSGQAQSIDVEGKMTLDFPAGAFNETPPQLVVSQVTGDVPLPFKGDVALMSYDVALGDLHNLAEPLQISIKYDPAKLKAGLPAQVQLGVMFRDGASGRWVALPFQVDETTHKISFEMDHLSVVAIYLHTQADSYCETAHFMISYNQANIDTGAGSMSYKSGLKSCQDSSPKTPPDFIVAVSDYLEAAFAGYNKNNIPLAPPQGEHIRVDAAYLSDNPLWGNTSAFDTLTGELVITTDPWGYPELLRQDCAHELFHYWQYGHMNQGSYLGSQWWMDATADYAADKVAYDGSNFGPTNSMGKNIRPDFLNVSLETTADYHAYSSSYFVDFLVNQSSVFTSLRDLWDASTTTSDPIRALKGYLKDKLNTDFADVYADFANYMLFDPASKLPIKSPVWDSKAVNDSMTWRDGNTETKATAHVQGYASLLWGLRVDSARFMSVSWTNPVIGQVRIIPDENSDERSGPRAMYWLYGGQTAKFLMKPETTVYFLMVNPNSGPLDFNLDINSSDVQVYSVHIDYSSTDDTCVQNAAWGTPTALMEIDQTGKAAIHYDSSKDDYYWSQGAEHTILASGSGEVTNNKLEANLKSTDTVLLGADSTGAPVKGTISLDLSFAVERRDGDPFGWDPVSANGSASVNLPATTSAAAYSCTCPVKAVDVTPALDFPLGR